MSESSGPVSPAPSVRGLVGVGGWWLGERAVALIALLVSQIVVIRALQPESFGTLSVLLAFLALLQPLMQFGVSGILSQALLKSPEQESAIFGTALALRAVGCIAAALIALIALGAGWVELNTFFLLILLVGQIFTIFNVFDYHFQINFAACRLVPYRIAAIVVGATLKIAAALSDLGLNGVVIAFAIDFALQGAAYLLAYQRTLGSISTLRVDSSWRSWLLARSPWLLLSGLAEIVYLKIDVLMINHFITRSDAGQYAAATKISEIWFIFPIVIVTTVFPFLWRFRDDPIEWKRRIQMTLDGLAWLGITAAIVISLIGEALVVWLFGAAYSMAATVLVIHIWGGVFIFMRAVLSRWLIAEDLLPLSLLTHLAGAIVNIGLNFWWIPKFGIVGAAWATVVSYAVAGWLALFLSVSTRSMGVAMLKALLLPMRTRDVRYYLGLIWTQRTSQS